MIGAVPNTMNKGTENRKRFARFARFAMVLAPMLIVAAPAEAKGGSPWQAAGIVAAGPLVLLVCLASMAVVYLIAASFRKQESLVTLAQSAAVEANKGKILNTLWGVIAEILLISAGMIIGKVHPAGLLVVLVLFLALALAGLGACVSAAVAGRRFHIELAGGEVSPLTSLGVGLGLFFLAAALPIVGWIVVLLLAANGVGSILTASTQAGNGPTLS